MQYTLLGTRRWNQRRQESETDRTEEPKLRRQRQCMRAIFAAQFVYDIVEVESDSRFRDTRDLGYFSLPIALGQRAQAIPLPRRQLGVFLHGSLRLANLDVVDPHEVVTHCEQIARYRAEQCPQLTRVATAGPCQYCNLSFGEVQGHAQQRGYAESADELSYVNVVSRGLL